MTDEKQTRFCVHGRPWDESIPCDEAPESSHDRLRPSRAGSTHHDFGDYDLGGGRMVSDQYRAIPTPGAEPTSYNTERDRAGQIALLVEDVEHRRAIAEEAHALMDAADIPQMGLVTRVTALVDEVRRLRLVVSGRPGTEPTPEPTAIRHLILERGWDQWTKATAICSCGFRVREPSGKQRDAVVMKHLEEVSTEERDPSAPWPADEAEARLVSALADFVTQANANTSEPAHLMFRHTPEEQPMTTKRSFTVVRLWRVEADTVLQALDAAPRELEPDEIHVGEGSPDDLYDWLRRDRSRCESCGNVHVASQACT